jgi:RNA polymerase sigma factor (sigma-70 family)
MDPDHSNFPATRGSLLLALRSPDPARREYGIAEICGGYWRPVYKYLRLRWSAPEAQDLCQGFFVEVLERDLLARFDPGKSRLRTYLRLCVDSFASNSIRDQNREKRGGRVPHLALDFASAERDFGAAALDPALLLSPESLEEFFEREWIRSLFETALEGLRRECHASGKALHFALFQARDLDEEDVSYQALAERHGLKVTDVTNHLAWVRREFRRLVLERLRELCATEEEFRSEARRVLGWRTP